jgi:hypothetical protein
VAVIYRRAEVELHSFAEQMVHVVGDAHLIYIARGTRSVSRILISFIPCAGDTNKGKRNELNGQVPIFRYNSLAVRVHAGVRDRTHMFNQKVIASISIRDIQSAQSCTL